MLCSIFTIGLYMLPLVRISLKLNKIRVALGAYRAFVTLNGVPFRQQKDLAVLRLFYYL